MKREIGDVLSAAVDAALAAGKLLRAEFHRPGGPRGSGGHAEVDEQAERVIREKILAAFPAAYCGEETGSAHGNESEYIWLVDPNDGTSAYLKGWRGSAVSIALVHKGPPVVGAVYAFGYPDDDGEPIGYGPSGQSHCRWCFGGGPAAVEALYRRDWGNVFGSPAGAASPYTLVRPERGASVPDPGRLARAQGCLLGQLAGDSLGGLVEFSSAAKIKAKYPAGLRELMDGGHWGILAGQPTDDSEMSLMLARSIVQNKGYELAAALDAYLHWYSSPPFDIGGTTSAALRGARRGRTPQERLAGAKQHASTTSQANGSLMRISPLGIFGAGNPAAAADWARADSGLTHPHPACQDACAVFVAAIATAITAGRSAQECYQAALDEASRSSVAAPVTAALRAAVERPPEDYQTQQGWVLIALQNAFYQLLHAASLEEGVVQTVMAGGDTDTNAAIAGALLGAVHGRDALPPQWLRSILSCRPLPNSGTSHPRPTEFWPVDALRLAEKLLVLGGEHTASFGKE